MLYTIQEPIAKMYCKTYDDLAKLTRVLVSMKIQYIITPMEKKSEKEGDFDRVLCFEFNGTPAVTERVRRMMERCTLIKEDVETKTAEKVC